MIVQSFGLLGFYLFYLSFKFLISFEKANESCPGIGKMRCISFPFENSSCSSGSDKLFDYLIGNSIISLLLFSFWMLYLAAEFKSETDKKKLKGLFIKLSTKKENAKVDLLPILKEENIIIANGEVKRELAKEL